MLSPRFLPKSLTGFCLAAMLLVAGCFPHYYVPNTQNTPMIRTEGDVSGSFHVSTGNLSEFHGAYGITENVAVQINGGFASFGNDVDGDGGSGKYFQLGIGYYSNPSDHVLFDVYSLAAFGDLENHFPSTLRSNPGTTGKITANAIRIGIQPSISLYNDYLSITGSAQLSSLNFSSIDGSLIFAGENQIEYLMSNNKNILFEPAVTLRAGIKNVKLQTQVAQSFNLSNPDFSQVPAIMSVGVTFQIGK